MIWCIGLKRALSDIVSNAVFDSTSFLLPCFAGGNSYGPREVDVDREGVWLLFVTINANYRTDCTTRPLSTKKGIKSGCQRGIKAFPKFSVASGDPYCGDIGPGLL